MYILGLRNVIITLLAGVSPLLLGSVAEPAVVEEVLRSWNTRPNMLNSFHFECRLEEVRMVQVDTGEEDNPYGVFSHLLSKDPVPMKATSPLISHLSFSMDNRKLAVRSNGDSWDTANLTSRKSTFASCFNGQDCKMLIHDDVIPLGTIESKTTPGMQLTNSSLLVAFWLSYAPLDFLARLGYEPNEMVLKELKEFHEGVECEVLEVPRKGKGVMALIYVDSSRDYLPTRFQSYRQGLLQNETSIAYQAHPGIGWIVSGWESKRFLKADRVERTLAAEVTDVVVNEELDGSLFDLKFPIGTHILIQDDENDSRYAIQEADGVQRAIPENHFGSLSDDTLQKPAGRIRGFALLLNAMIIALLIIAVAVKYLRNVRIS